MFLLSYFTGRMVYRSRNSSIFPTTLSWRDAYQLEPPSPAEAQHGEGDTSGSLQGPPQATVPPALSLAVRLPQAPPASTLASGQGHSGLRAADDCGHLGAACPGAGGAARWGVPPFRPCRAESALAQRSLTQREVRVEKAPSWLLRHLM